MVTNEVLMQLFVDGPTWDGNLISKSDRDDLVEQGYADRAQGWNFLTACGVRQAVTEGMKAKDWYDKRFYRKSAILS